MMTKFKYPKKIRIKEHRILLETLEEFNRMLKAEKISRVFFGGGTSITLFVEEYRFSEDLDFFIYEKESLKKLKRFALKNKDSFEQTRTDLYGKIVFVKNNIKIEILQAETALLGKPLRVDDLNIIPIENLILEKLRACVYRGLDRWYLGRDLLDLLVLYQTFSLKHFKNPVLEILEENQDYANIITEVYQILLLKDIKKSVLEKLKIKESKYKMLINTFDSFIRDLKRLAKKIDEKTKKPSLA